MTWGSQTAAHLCSHIEDINSWDESPPFLSMTSWLGPVQRGNGVSVLTTKNPLKPLWIWSLLSPPSPAISSVRSPTFSFFHFASNDLLILHVCNSPLITGESSLVPRGLKWILGSTICNGWRFLHCIFHSLKVWTEVYTVAPNCVFSPDQNLTSPPGSRGLNHTRLEVITALGWETAGTVLK